MSGRDLCLIVAIIGGLHLLFHCGEARAQPPAPIELGVIQAWSFTAADWNPDGYHWYEVPASGSDVRRVYVTAWRWVPSCLDFREIKSGNWKPGESCKSMGPNVKEFGERSEISDHFIRVPEPGRDVMLLAGVVFLFTTRRMR